MGRIIANSATKVPENDNLTIAKSIPQNKSETIIELKTTKFKFANLLLKGKNLKIIKIKSGAKNG